MSKQGNLQSLIDPIVISMGYESVGVEYMSQGKHSVLRVYIDKPDGITVDDCSAVSGQLSAMLDVEDPIRGEYHLEVSSPGLDRPLFTEAQFEQFIGHKCVIRMKMPIDGQRKFTGLIKALVDGTVELEMENKVVSLSVDMVDKANLVPEF
jgi:ribosome maturation factor RimP